MPVVLDPQINKIHKYQKRRAIIAVCVTYWQYTGKVFHVSGLEPFVAYMAILRFTILGNNVSSRPIKK